MTQIDYYGEKDNYIHLKFGRAQKRYNFTEAFITQYPEFTALFTNYFDKDEVTPEETKQIINYAYDNDIPVHFYYNFTDTPATSHEEIINYLDRENK